MIKKHSTYWRKDKLSGSEGINDIHLGLMEAVKRVELIAKALQQHSDTIAEIEDELNQLKEDIENDGV